MSLQSAVRIGSQTPSLLHLPANRHANALDDLLELADIAGLKPDPWQQFCTANGTWHQRTASRKWRWSAFENVVDVCRQNGKGDIKILRQLGGLFLFHEKLQVHTAHEFKTCYEHFRKVVDIIEATPEFHRMLKPRTGIRTGAGDQAIELKNGDRIRFIARSGSSGRGFSIDGALYLDEAFALTPAMMGALMPTLRAMENPQIWYTSSAAHATSEVLHRLRARAVAGDDPRLFYAGWNNEPGADPTDRDNWYRANPALGIRVDEELMAAEQRSMASAEFARECLGIPDDPGGEVAIPLPLWDSLCSPDVAPSAPIVFCVDVTPDRSFATVAACGGGVVEVDNRPGIRWTVERLAKHRGATVGIDKSSPAGSLIADLERAGLKVQALALDEIAKACGAFYDDVADSKVRFRSNGALDDAVSGAVKQRVGDAWRWARRDTSVDMSPLMAATIAHWLGRNPPPRGGLFVAVT